MTGICRKVCGRVEAGKSGDMPNPYPAPEWRWLGLPVPRMGDGRARRIGEGKMVHDAGCRGMKRLCRDVQPSNRGIWGRNSYFGAKKPKTPFFLLLN